MKFLQPSTSRYRWVQFGKKPETPVKDHVIRSLGEEIGSAEANLSFRSIGNESAAFCAGGGTGHLDEGRDACSCVCPGSCSAGGSCDPKVRKLLDTEGVRSEAVHSPFIAAVRLQEELEETKQSFLEDSGRGPGSRTSSTCTVKGQTEVK